MLSHLSFFFTSLLSRLRHFIKFEGEDVHYINGADTLPSPLTAAEEAEVFRRIEEGDDSARELLITHNLRLVVYIARKFENSGVGI